MFNWITKPFTTEQNVSLSLLSGGFSGFLFSTYDIGNPVSGLGQVQKCSEIKPVNGIPNLPS
jgi:hypothetical protein